MSLDGKKVFLAGATGVVGSSIINYILDNFTKTKIRASYYHTKPFIKNKRVEYIHGDLRLPNICRNMLTGCDYAIMAAANTTGASLTISQPWEQINDNLLMNLQMLRAFCSGNIKRVVHIGSATLYQEFNGHIREEELDLNIDPHHAYQGIGWVNRFTEKLYKFCHEQFGMEISIVRAANIYGPYAKFNALTSNFIPALIRKAVDKMDPFEVWGNPDVTRDVLYSEDFARAIVMLINSKINFETFNIGSGEQATVNKVVELVLKYTGHKPREIKYILDKPTTIKFRALDCTKAKNMLGWQPQYTIAQGIERTVLWWLENQRWWKK